MTALLVRERVRNFAQTAVLVAALGLLLAGVGASLGGAFGAIVALASVAILTAVAPNAPTDWLLRRQGARPIARSQAPDLHEQIRALSHRAGLPSAPALYLVPSPAPQAFATGAEGSAAIAVSQGLLASLSTRELRGVLAHEIAHLASGDLNLMRFATLTRAITASMSRFGLLLALFNLPLVMLGVPAVPWLAVALMVVAPILGSALELAVSRAREFDADARAVALTGDPEGLAAALNRLDRAAQHPLTRLLGIRPPEPPDWLRTHPTTRERVARLAALARSARVPTAARARGLRAGRFPNQRPPRVIYVGR